jgi:hypothetical protein
MKYQPILVFAYNRVETLDLLLKSIPMDHGRKVVISIDGARLDGKTQNSFLVRSLCKKFGLKFPDQVEVIDRKDNLGLQSHCILAMTEFFKKYESGIVFDDDIVPTDSFFKYMDHYLGIFDGKGEIKLINGWTPLFLHETNGVCHETKYFVSWGWGTWATFFHQIDFGLKNYQPGSSWWSIGTCAKTPSSLGFRRYWTKRFNRIFSSPSNRSWDWELLFELWRMGGKVLSPSERLVSNLGFDEYAFHPNSGSKRQREMASPSLTINLTSETDILKSNKIEKLYERKMWDLSYQRLFSFLNYRLKFDKYLNKFTKLD